jgi:hypothetical protein
VPAQQGCAKHGRRCIRYYTCFLCRATWVPQEADNQVYLESISEGNSRAADGEALRVASTEADAPRKPALSPCRSVESVGIQKRDLGISCPAQPSGTVVSVIMLGLADFLGLKPLCLSAE